MRPTVFPFGFTYYCPGTSHSSPVSRSSRLDISLAPLALTYDALLTHCKPFNFVLTVFVVFVVRFGCHNSSSVAPRDFISLSDRWHGELEMPVDASALFYINDLSPVYRFYHRAL